MRAVASGVIGREKDLEALAACFADEADTRLVTLLGPGGIGKSTLARSYAATHTERRAIVVDLHGATTIVELVDRIFAAMSTSSVRLAASTALDGGATNDVERARAALDAHGDVLLVLDDFGALTAFATESVGVWLECCPELAILVTSRERLGIAGERIFEVGPLRGGTNHQADPAVALLVTSARRTLHGFAPRPEDANLLFEIAATLLEGVPLALELAGARLPLVGAADLLRELRAGIGRLGLHGVSPRGGPARHTSLDAAVRGSFEALGPHEQDALAQLTVFRGGFTAESVKAIVVASEQTDAITMLDMLRARSLVRSRDPGAARFDLYAQVRDFVVSARPGPIPAAIGRHAAWFVANAEKAQHTWLIVERENILEVIRRVAMGGEAPHAQMNPQMNAQMKQSAELALRAIVAAKDVLLARGEAAELVALVSPLVERTRDSGADPRLSARVLLLRGALRREEGDVRASLKDLLGAESMAKALNDDVLGAECSLELGMTVRYAGELDAAKQSFDRAARAFGGASVRVKEAEAIALLAATSAEAGDLGMARTLCERAVALAGADRLLGATLHWLLARVLAEIGGEERSGALEHADAALRLSRAEDDARNITQALVLRGLVLHDEGDLEAATRVLEGASAMMVAGDAAIVRGHLGAIAREQGRMAEAYAALAEARDASLRSKKHPAYAAYFGAYLSAIDLDVGRRDAAIENLDPRANERALDTPNLEPGALREADRWWPISAREVVELQRSLLFARREAASTAPFVNNKKMMTLFGRIFARGLTVKSSSPLPPDDALVVGVGGAWFRPPRGARVGLDRRRSLALLLDHLATARIESSSSSTDVVPVRTATQLFAAAWPGEKAIATAASHRVRVAIATLRKMGLRDALVTTPDGYAFSRSVAVVRA